jgi:hypothetical protein
MNRQVHCHGDEPHYTCFSCIETYIKTEIGDSRCRVLCTAGCGAGFEPAQLNLLADKKLLKKLADLQQEKDIRDAGLDDLEECPFCDYKAIMPPIEENFEFTCANPECEKVSCRRCKFTTHIPMSCEQYAKEKNANSRHTIEEAMTAAMVRSCNKCKKQFIKDFGCNKMTCPSCRNLQCYVCSETLKGYDHFDQTPQGDPRRGGKCPLYDNLEERHEREVKAAEEAARAKVIAANPDVAAEDLEIRVSDAVKNSTAQRIQRAGPEGLGGGPHGWGGRAAIAMNGMNGAGGEDAEMWLAALGRHVARPVARPFARPIPGRRPLLINFQEEEQAALRAEQRRRGEEAEARRQLHEEQQQLLFPPEGEIELDRVMRRVRDQRRARARRQQEQLPFAQRPPVRAPRHPALPPQPNPIVDVAPPGNAEYYPWLGYMNQAPAAQPAVPGPPTPQLQRFPPAEYMDLAHHYNPVPPNAIPDGREEARLANVARNLHQLELMRLQHDVRQGLPEAGLRERPRRRRLD